LDNDCHIYSPDMSAHERILVIFRTLPSLHSMWPVRKCRHNHFVESQIHFPPILIRWTQVLTNIFIPRGATTEWVG
jgi:hypothetical protein